MSGLFDGELTDDVSALIDDILRKQVDLCFEKEVDALVRHGLGMAATVLDIGTGNGYFIKRLAERFPDKEFTGIDKNLSMLEIANDGSCKNVKFVREECPNNKMSDRFDFIVSRLAMYYMPNREDVIKWAYGMLKKGGRMCVVDVDDDLVYCRPEGKAFLKLMEFVRNITEPCGADRSVGRKLPFYLSKAGFTDINFELFYWSSNVTLTKDAFEDFWLAEGRVSNKLAPDKFTATDLDAFEKFIKSVYSSSDVWIAYPMTVTSGVKNNRFAFRVPRAALRPNRGTILGF